MCGIAGIFNYDEIDGGVETEELVRMSSYMRRRGPDGSGLWVSDKRHIGLAHRRLSIIDLSEAAAQPMTEETKRITIVFNGEIYNYRQLRRDLEAENIQFKTHSDTEVILKLYLFKKERFVEYLRGMFALALWDTSEQRLVLARDPFGIKPLYYADSGHSLRFASQVKALLAGGVKQELDSAGTVGFWLWGHVPEPYTLYRKIRSVPPGSLLIADDGKAPKIYRYCDVVKILKEPHEKRGVEQENLKTLLNDSVKNHLISDVPVGVFLSSGIDSATLCALSKSNSDEPLRTVTLGFTEYRGTANDEVPLAEQIAKGLDTDHQTRWVTREDFQGSLLDILECMDQPTIDGVNTYFVSKVTAATKLKVAISGVGGDEFFGGYPSFEQIPKLVRSLAWTTKLHSLGKAFRWISAPLLRHLTSPKYASILEYGGTYGGAYLLRRALYMPWELPHFLDEDLVREGWNELCAISLLRETIEGQPTPHCIISALEIVWYLQSRLLRDTDWAGMAHSLEIRTPLVDIELLKGLVPYVQRPTGITKRSLVNTVRERLPQAVLNRPKSGFSVPIRDWLLEAGDVNPKERGLRSWARYVGAHFGIA